MYGLCLVICFHNVSSHHSVRLTSDFIFRNAEILSGCTTVINTFSSKHSQTINWMRDKCMFGDHIKAMCTLAESTPAGSTCCGSWCMRGVLSASSRWPASCTDAQTSVQTPQSRCNAGKGSAESRQVKQLNLKPNDAATPTSCVTVTVPHRIRRGFQGWRGRTASPLSLGSSPATQSSPGNHNLGLCQLCHCGRRQQQVR